MNSTVQEQPGTTEMDSAEQNREPSGRGRIDMNSTVQEQSGTTEMNGAGQQRGLSGRGSIELNDSGQDPYIVPAWLTQAIIPELVCDGLRHQVPEFSSGQLTIISFEIKRFRLRDGQHSWSGICLLTVEGKPPAEREVLTLHGTLIPPGFPEPVKSTDSHAAAPRGLPAQGAPATRFGTDQWRCYLPELRLELCMQPQRATLAALPQLTDPEAARRLLEASIRSGGNPAYSDLRIQSSQPQVMRYKPGSRCTILYHLDYEPTLSEGRTWPDVVVAKTYRGDKGKIAYVGMNALWHSPLGASQTVTIAEPLAYLPDEHILVQSPIGEEMTLKELVRKTLQTTDGHSGSPPGAEQMDELASYLRKTAAGLAEMHQCGVHIGETVTWEDELAEIYESRARLATVLPQLGNLAEDLLDHLQELAAAHPADPLAPAHRSFRPAQVLLYEGEIGFIDFDGFCQAEPAMDLALFMTTIKNMVLNKAKSKGKEEVEANGAPDPEKRLARLIQAEALGQIFLTEYEKHVPVSPNRIALWETLQLLSLVLGSWKKLKLDRLENCRFMLERHLKTLMPEAVGK